jgi:hypothetical protein
MKIAIGHKIQTGPYGGGNSFVKVLAKALENIGHKVFYDLDEVDLDFIIMTDPRGRSPNVSFAARKILRHLKKNPNAIVIHRINECDERKGTHFMNFRLRASNFCADHTVFVGTWLKSLKLVNSVSFGDSSVILNGADVNVFNPSQRAEWTVNQTMKLVTHHWGGNWMKGFDVYSKLDDAMGSDKWRGKFELTYIGNLPKGFKFKNVRYLTPLSGFELASELKRHHVYITASINEPGGNHQIEGGLCGLPLIYRNSGCMPEYCDGFGVSFDGDDVFPAIELMMDKYPELSQKILDYPCTSDMMASRWIEMLNGLDANRGQIIANRKDFLPFRVLNYLIP